MPTIQKLVRNSDAIWKSSLHWSVRVKQFLLVLKNTIFSTQQENSWAVLNFGNLGNWNKKFQIWEFPFHFRDRDRTGSGQSWMERELDGTGSELKGNLKDSTVWNTVEALA